MRVNKKIRKARGEGGPEGSIVSWTWQDCGIRELRAAVAACIDRHKIKPAMILAWRRKVS